MAHSKVASERCDVRADYRAPESNLSRARSGCSKLRSEHANLALIDADALASSKAGFATLVEGGRTSFKFTESFMSGTLSNIVRITWS